MKEYRTYKAPTIIGYCPRCRAKTVSEHIDHPDEYERDEVCAVCGALKSVTAMKKETPAMIRVAMALQIASIIACLVALVAVWFVDGPGMPVGFVAAGIGAACQIGTVVLYRNVPKEYPEV